MADAVIGAIFGNGPVETPLALGREEYISDKHGAFKGAEIADTFVATARSLGIDPNSRLARAVAGAAALAHAGGFANIENWFRDEADTDDEEGEADEAVGNANAGGAAGRGRGAHAAAAAGRGNGQRAAADRRPAVEDVKYDDEILASAVIDAIGLIAATKVNWWKCNHHTGGTIATGFAARALRLFSDRDEPIDEVRTSIIWRAGHWFNTAAWIAALGATGPIDPALRDASRELAARIRADEAVAKRIRSAPAGTANFEAVYAALAAIAVHPVCGSAHSPAVTEWASWTAVHADIANNGTFYHIGAAYLTKGGRRALPVVPDAVISFAFTCLRFMNRDATLLKAAVFNNVGEDAGTLTAIRAASNFREVERDPVGLVAWTS